MAFRMDIDHGRHRVLLVAEGAITMDAWAIVGAQILLEHVWHYSTLYDFTAPAAAMPGPADMVALTPVLRELVQQEGSRGAVAFAAAGDDDYERLRTWIDTSGCRLLPLVRVFRTRDDAERWLDAVSDVPRPRV